MDSIVIEVILDEVNPPTYISTGPEIVESNEESTEIMTEVPPQDQFVDEESGEYVMVSLPDEGNYNLCWVPEEDENCGYIDEDWDIEPPVESIKCPHCDRVYPNAEKLRRHMRNHQERKHACRYCDKRFLYRKDRITHERTHTGDRPFKCDVCGKGFVQKCTLDTHMIGHTKRHKDEVCDICDKSYYHKKSLALHKKEKHSVEGGKLRQCPFCCRQFNAYTKYKYHIDRCREQQEKEKLDGGSQQPLLKRRKRKEVMINQRTNASPVMIGNLKITNLAAEV